MYEYEENGKTIRPLQLNKDDILVKTAAFKSSLQKSEEIKIVESFVFGKYKH